VQGLSTRRRTGLRVLLASALAAIALPMTPTPASAIPCSSQAFEYITLNTLHVKMGKLKKSYRRGDVVTLKVKVSRPSENDPIGLGLSVERPVSRPAEDVNVGVGLTIGRVFLPGYSLTNAAGKATVKVKIEKYAPAGKMAHVQIYAYMERANTPCLIVEEQGYREVPNAFKVKA
jgi:hypothetical protein